jgi:hypothetical protein
MGRSLLAHWWLLALVAIEIAAALVVGMDIHQSSGVVALYMPVYVKVMPVMLVALAIGRLVQIAVVLRPALPLSFFLKELREETLTVERIAHALPALVAIPFFFGAFTTLKSAVSFYQGFHWDQQLDLVDRWLHGGYAPWELLQPLLGQPIVTAGISTLYATWFFVIALVWTWQAVSMSNPALRARFLASMVLTWIVFGSLLANLLSSAGPCYFGRVTGLADPYAPLMDYLRQTDEVHSVWALTAQEMLWAAHSASRIGLGAGISALPSMHVAIVLLVALLLCRTNRLAGLLAILYGIGIALGSVHLGWHYALDGYVGGFGALAVWYAVGRAMAWREQRAGGAPRGNWAAGRDPNPVASNRM